MSLKFSKDHEWVNSADAAAAVVGITVHAQDALGDVVFVDLPEVGATLAQGEVAGVVESVKAAADVYMPVSGEVVEVNEALRADPSLANSDPLGAGWFFKVKLSAPAELDALTEANTRANETSPLVEEHTGSSDGENVAAKMKKSVRFNDNPVSDVRVFELEEGRALNIKV